MNAAIEASRRGCKLTLIDEGAKAGGQIFRQSALTTAPSIGLPGELRRKHDLLRRFNAVVDRIDYRPYHTAYALFDGPELHISDNKTCAIIKPDVVVLATGVCERGVPFPGWTLPGVVYAGGAQALLKAQGVAAGERVVIAGAGPLSVAVAAQLSRAGVRVAGVALLHPLRTMLLHPYALWKGRKIIREGRQYFKILKRNHVEIFARYVPLRADGDSHVDSVQLAQHDGTGRAIVGTEMRIECDVLAINYGFTANSELAAMAGANMQYAAERGGWLPVVDRYCRTSLPGVLMAGDGAGLRGAWVAEAEGRIAGAVAACYYDERSVNRIRQELRDWFRQRQHHESFQSAVRQSLHLPAGVWTWADEDTTICRCECVDKKRIQKAVEDGHVSLNGIKRNTRAGMGWCGGRMCMQNVAAFVSSGKPPVDMQAMTPRPLARPVSLGALGEQQTSGANS